MEAYAASLLNITLLLVLGIIVSAAVMRFSNARFRLSNMIVLLVLGIVLSKTSIARSFLFMIDSAAVAAFSTIAVIIVVLDAAYSLKLNELDSTYRKAMFRFLVFLALNLSILSILSYLLFGSELSGNIYLAAMLSILMTSLSPGISNTKCDEYISKAKIPLCKYFEQIREEALIGMPFLLLLPFVFIPFAQGGMSFNLLSDSISIINSLLVGASAGILVAIAVMSIIRSKYSEYLSSSFLLIAAFAGYALAEQLGGSGIAAVIALGMFYSIIYVRSRLTILEHSSAVMFILEAIVFILVAFAVNLNVSPVFILKSIILFLALILIRMVAVIATTKTSSAKELLFITLQMPKGISIVVVILALSNFAVSGMDNMLSIALYIVLLSHIVSLIATQKSGCFVGDEKKEKCVKCAETKIAEKKAVKKPAKKIVKAAGKPKKR